MRRAMARRLFVVGLVAWGWGAFASGLHAVREGSGLRTVVAAAPAGVGDAPVLGRAGFIGGGSIRAAQRLGVWVLAQHGNVLRLIDPVGGKELGAIRLPHMADSLAVDGSWAYAHGGGALSVIDWTSPGAPKLASTLELSALAEPKTFPNDPDPIVYPGVAAWDGHVYLTLDRSAPTRYGEETTQLFVLERETSGRLKEVSRVDVGASPQSMYGDGPRLVMVQLSQGPLRSVRYLVRVYDLADPVRPRRIELLAEEGVEERVWAARPRAALAGRRIVPPDGLARELVVVADREARELFVWDLGGDQGVGGRRPVARLAMPAGPGETIVLEESQTIVAEGEEVWLSTGRTVGSSSSATRQLLRVSLRVPARPRLVGRVVDPPAEPLLGADLGRYFFGGRSGQLSIATLARLGPWEPVSNNVFWVFGTFNGIPAITAASVDGDLAVYAAGDLPGSAHVGVVDLSPVYGPRVVARLPARGAVTAVALKGRRLLVAGPLVDVPPKTTLHVVDLEQPARPLLRGGLSWRGPVRDIEMAGPPGFAVAVADGWLTTIDLRDPERPLLGAEIEAGAGPGDGRLAAREDLVLAYTLYSARVDVVSVADPDRPRIVDRLAVPQQPYALPVVAAWSAQRSVIVRDRQVMAFAPRAAGSGFEPAGTWALPDAGMGPRWSGAAALGDDLLWAERGALHVVGLEGGGAEADGPAVDASQDGLSHRQRISLPAEGVPATDGRTVLVAAGEGGLHVLRSLGADRPWRIALPWGSTGR